MKLLDAKSLGAYNPFERLEEYLRLLPLAPSEGDPLFRSASRQARRKEMRCKPSPMGINEVANIMKGLCKSAGLGDKGYTNHSLRAYMITTLGGEGCNSEAIAQRNGHRSSSGAQQRMRSALEAEILQQKPLAGGRC